MKSKIIASTLLGIGFLIGATALSALADWTGAPAGGPPTCRTDLPTTDPNYREGCFAPVNVGANLQNKIGSLTLGGLGVVGNFTFTPLNSSNIPVAPTAGQVLMADDTSPATLSAGKVKWGSGGGVLWRGSQYIIDSQSTDSHIYTFSHNLGTSDYIVNVWLDYTTPSTGTPTKNGSLLVSQAAFTDSTNNTDNTLSVGATIKITNNTVEIRTPVRNTWRATNCITGSWSDTLFTYSTEVNDANYFDCKRSGWLIVELR